MRVTYLPRIVAVAAGAGMVAVAIAGQTVPAVAAFDQARAFADAKTMVALGPRPLGSDALEQNRHYIEEQLRAVGLEPVRDEFTAATPIGRNASWSRTEPANPMWVAGPHAHTGGAP